MEAILVDTIHHSLRDFMYRNAIFICERLCSEFPSEVNLQLLASCYLRNNQAYCAYHILKGTQTAQSRYLFAISCFRMDFLKEAEAALSPPNEPSAEVPNGAAGNYLLGLIYRYTERRTNAIHHFKEALSLNPLMWAAYEELCLLGAADEASMVFGEAAARCIHKQYIHQGLASQSLNVSGEDRSFVSTRNFSLEDASPRHSKHVQDNNNIRDIPGHSHNSTGTGGAQSLTGSSSNLSFYNTPSPMATQFSGVAPPPLCRNVPQNGPNLSTVAADISPKVTVNAAVQPPRRKVVDEGKLRKISNRLFIDSGTRRSTRLSNDAGITANAASTMVAANGTTSTSSKYLGYSKPSSMSLRSMTNRRGQTWANENIDEGIRCVGIRNETFDDTTRLSVSSSISVSQPSLESRMQENEGATMPGGGGSVNSSRIISGTSEILSLLGTLGEGYRLSCLYRCQDALDAYLKLPAKHYNTGWVLSQVGKAYFELVDYLQAERAFSLSRNSSPYNLEGMDIYSTVLYHLKEDMKLSYLSRELISTDRLAPQSWCAMGNCYSMQKDHETALKNFQRAVQLNPRFAYAHTLCGHEYVSLEDFESGIKSYQTALTVDSRHYNSWYGLGMIYLRQEKFDFAEHHFRMAFHINPRPSVIMSYLGTALHTLKRSHEALMMLEKAIMADTKNPLPMYQKANILMNMESFDEALEVLQELKECAPRESSVYALMGRIYKRRNMPDQAMLHYGLALDLKPSATDVATIKAAIEKLLVPDELDDSL